MAQANEEQKLQDYLFLAFLAGTGLVFYWIVRDYALPAIYAFLIAYALLPIKNFFSRKFNQKISSVLAIFTVFLALLLFAYFFLVQLYDQLRTYVDAESVKNTVDFSVQFLAWLPEQMREYIMRFREQAGGYLLGLAVSFVSNIPGIALSAFLVFFITYFILVDFSKISRYIYELVPVKDKKRFSRNIGQATKSIIFGYGVIAVLEFFISAAGFYLAGSPMYLILALLIAISAFIPFVGPFAIWLPVFLVYLFQQDYQAAVIVLITGGILTGVVDNFLIYLLVGKSSKIHPVVMLFGVLGGVPLFGILGFILGPIAILVFVEAFNQLRLDKKNAAVAD